MSSAPGPRTGRPAGLPAGRRPGIPAGAAEVRLARVADAAAIAAIHVRGWQAAYRGIVPDEILDGFSIPERAERLRQRLAGRGADALERVWVVDDGTSLTGFAMSGPARDESAPPPDGAGEVYAIYLDPDRIGAGHGRVLFEQAVRDLTERGFAPLVVWVLEANPRARRFYEAATFVTDGARNVIDFDGVPVPEVRYRLDARLADAPTTP